MTITELSQTLGNFGEFVGAIAVVATLVYLAMQVRHSKEAMEANTRSLDEGRRLALAQAYENRTVTLLDNLRDIRDSRHVELFATADSDRPEDQIRTRLWLRWWANYLDNVYYQYQQGFIDEEFYESPFKGLVRRDARHWEALRIGQGSRRPRFRAEVERILSESEHESEENEQ